MSEHKFANYPYLIMIDAGEKLSWKSCEIG